MEQFWLTVAKSLSQVGFSTEFSGGHLIVDGVGYTPAWRGDRARYTYLGGNRFTRADVLPAIQYILGTLPRRKKLLTQEQEQQRRSEEFMEAIGNAKMSEELYGWYQDELVKKVNYGYREGKFCIALSFEKLEDFLMARDFLMENMP